MTHLSKGLFIVACSLALIACGGEKPAPTPVKEAVKPVASKLSLPKAPRLNYCHNGEYNPKKPFKFVYFNLTTHKDEMKRIRDTVKAQMAELKDLPDEAKAKAIEPQFAKSQVLAALVIQPLGDQIQRVSATLCNFSIYEKDKCTGLLSRSVTNAEMIEGALAYTAPDAKGQPSRVIFSRKDYSDITIEARGKTSQWSRDADGTENFISIDPLTEVSWTESPDCSGQFSQRRKNTSIEATWTSPKTGALAITYKYCRKGKCFEGTL